MHYIDEISWSVASAEGKVISGKYCREIEQLECFDCRKVKLATGHSHEDWLIFEKYLEQNSDLKVEVAFLIRQDKSTSQEQIIPVSNGSPLYVFLPTEIETELKFLVQGPYITTSARDNIIKDNK